MPGTISGARLKEDGKVMSFLTKEEFLKVEQEEIFPLKTREDGRFKGASLRARPMKALEEAQLIEAANQHQSPVFQAALWLLFTLVDENGERLFETGDLESLLKAIDSRELKNLHDQVVAKLTNGVNKELKNSEIQDSESSESSSTASV